MQFDPTNISPRAIYSLMVQLITPRPIAWISTVSNSGITNLAPYSFYNGVGANPPSLLFCPANKKDGSRKDSLTNVLETGEFVVNVVGMTDAERMNQSSAEYSADVSEIESLEIATLDSSIVGPPRVASSLAQFECRLLQHIELAPGPAGANIVVGEIVMMHVDDSAIEDGRVDPAKFSNIGRMGGKSFVRTTDRFDLERPSNPDS